MKLIDQIPQALANETKSIYIALHDTLKIRDQSISSDDHLLSTIFKDKSNYIKLADLFLDQLHIRYSFYKDDFNELEDEKADTFIKQLNYIFFVINHDIKNNYLQTFLDYIQWKEIIFENLPVSNYQIDNEDDRYIDFMFSKKSDGSQSLDYQYKGQDIKRFLDAILDCQDIDNPTPETYFPQIIDMNNCSIVPTNILKQLQENYNKSFLSIIENKQKIIKGYNNTDDNAFSLKEHELYLLGVAYDHFKRDPKDTNYKVINIQNTVMMLRVSEYNNLIAGVSRLVEEINHIYATLAQLSEVDMTTRKVSEFLTDLLKTFEERLVI